jgi:hypothetical protein
LKGLDGQTQQYMQECAPRAHYVRVTAQEMRGGPSAADTNPNGNIDSPFYYDFVQIHLSE